MKTCLCVCLSVLLVAVSGRIKRPVVQARPVETDEMAVIMAECQRRVAINDTISHYVRVPSDCSAYAMCQFPVNPILQLCPAGLFFDDRMDVMSCVRPWQTDCRNDQGNPCANLPDGYNQDPVRSQILQGAYYECRNSLTIGGGWCDLGEQYLSFTRPCLAISDRPKPAQPTEAPIPCHLVAIPDNVNSFIQGNSVMACPGSTVFSQELCGCV